MNDGGDRTRIRLDEKRRRRSTLRGRGPSRTRRQVWIYTLCYAVLTVVLSGCASTLRPLQKWAGGGWLFDYDRAERACRRADRPLLILYQDQPEARRDCPIERALETPTVASMTEGFVRCRLYKPNEPDRRFVAQYGVLRAPALIVVHRDGTYHAKAGPASPSEVRAFLRDSRPPGDVPSLDPLLPRPASYEWMSDVASAKALARERDRPLLIVYYRSMSRDWLTLSELLERREVFLRVRDMVHCRVGVLSPWASTVETPYGTLALPALVIDTPDGAHRALPTPTSAAAVARFADAMPVSPDQGSPSASTAASVQR